MINSKDCLGFRMAELTVSQLIKIIIGVMVVVAMVYGAYYIFTHKIGSFFNSIPTEIFRSILKW